MDLLIADAVADLTVVPETPDTGSLRGDLVAFLQPRTRARTHAEQVVGALFSAARTNPQIRHAVDELVVAPLDEAATSMCAQSARSGHPVTDQRRRLLTTVLQAMSWQRYLGGSDPLTASDVIDLVNDVLLPIAQPGPVTGRCRR